MSQIPAYYPTLPFVGQIPGGGRPNFVVKVKGKFGGKSSSVPGRCNIDFVNSPSLNPALDIAFHLSIRTKEKKIVANSFQYGQWGSEVQLGTDNKSQRVKKDDTFTISIMAEGHECYNIRLNGSLLGPFPFRLPLELVQFIRISGDDLEVENVLTGDGTIFHFEN